jgi:prepilin-type processing-associated H-X9-DG protein
MGIGFSIRPNTKACGAGDETSHSLNTASSFHEGGVNVVFCDGTVEFISSNIDHKLWISYGTRNGFETFEKGGGGRL